MDLPGIEADRIEITPGPVRGTLRVSATPKERPDPAGRVLLGERSMRAAGVRSYTRTIPIGWDADVDNVRRTVSDGVLRITIPKLASARPNEKTP